MTTELATRPVSAEIERVLLGGDLAGLTEAQRLTYYNAVCESVGLNPLTQPFAYIRLNNKLTLYARKDCTDQLRKLHGVSVIIPARELTDDVYVVTARATDKTGRCDEAIGAVPLKGLQGEARANAMMKAETKAKRRVTLSVCGLGMLDENEVESIPGAVAYTPPQPGPQSREEAAPAVPKGTATTANDTGAAAVGDGSQAATNTAPATTDDEDGHVADEDPNVRVPVYQWNERHERWDYLRDEPKVTPSQNAKIHILIGKLGHKLDRTITGPPPAKKKEIQKDGKYRQKLAQFSKESTAQLSVREASNVIDWLEAAVAKWDSKLDTWQGGAPNPPEAVSDPNLGPLVELTSQLIANGHKSTDAQLAWVNQALMDMGHPRVISPSALTAGQVDELLKRAEGQVPRV